MRWEYKAVLVLLEILFLSTIVIVAAIHSSQIGQQQTCTGPECKVEYNKTVMVQNNTTLATKNATATAQATTKTSNTTTKAAEPPVIKPTQIPLVKQPTYVPTSIPKPTALPTPTPVPVKTVTIIFFYQDGCPACDQMKPIISQVAQKYPVTWVNLSVDKATGMQYGITDTPTILVNGQRLVGVVSYNAIIGAIG